MQDHLSVIQMTARKKNLFFRVYCRRKSFNNKLMIPFQDILNNYLNIPANNFIKARIIRKARFLINESREIRTIRAF